ncbi:unnamed protein product, partial [Didymodactylos carnosus]
MLLNVAKKCLCTTYYSDTFKQIINLKNAEFPSKGTFFVIECAHYISSYTGTLLSKDEVFCYTIIMDSDEIFKQCLSHKKLFDNVSLTQAMTYLIDILQMPLTRMFTKHLTVIDYLLLILQQTVDDADQFEQHAIELIASTTTLIYSLIYNSKFLSKCKNVTELFQKHSASNDKRISFNARMITYAINEDKAEEIEEPDKVITIFVSYLGNSVNDESQRCEGVPLKSLLTSLKILVQNDKIQVELVQQNGIPLLIECACESKFDATTIQLPSLENLWTMSFLPNAAEILKNHPDFIQNIKHKQLISSNNTDTRNVTNGLLWNLKEESERLLIIKEKAHDSSENSGESFEYDVMLSYSHNDEDICDKIYNCLTKDKFKVWLDKRQMYNSYMERMAEAIEKSEFILIFMSDSYKKSQNCQSEANYARENKRYLIPLKIHTDYKPNGWLGLLVAGL